MNSKNLLTEKDIIKIITCINLNYIENYNNYGEEETKELIKYWFESLVKYPRNIVFEATRRAIEKSEFAPKLSTLIREIEFLLNSDIHTDEQLWSELTAVLPRAYEISRYLTYSQHYNWASTKLNELYSELSEGLKLFVVNVSTLIEIAEMPTETLQFERTRFFKQIPTLKKQRADRLAAQRFMEQAKNNQTLLPKNDDKK